MYSPAVSQCVRSVRDPRGCSLGSSVAGGRYRRFSMDADNHCRGTQEGRGRLGVPFCLGRHAREIGHMTHDDSLATVSLVSRIHSEGVQPLRASEFWKLCEQIAQPGMLLGQTETHLLREHDLSAELSARIVALLDRARAMAFELEQLDQAGIWTLTPFDEGYPRRLVDRLGSKAPVLLHAAGDLGLLNCPGIGVVGSRDVNAEGGEVAQNAAERAAGLSGGARGVDQLAMSTAFQSGGTVIGVVADSLMRKLKSPDVRRVIYDDRTVICTPYSPKARRSASGTPWDATSSFTHCPRSPWLLPAKSRKAAHGRRG